MMTVRFPSGFSIQYNNANYLAYKDHAWEISTKDPLKGGTWVASVQISSGAIVEIVQPCATYDANTLSDEKLREALDLRLASLPHSTLKRLKDRLRKFDVRTGRWR